ncbi:MAG: ankyrin repeat domain-containing protein, partial [Candidatus Aminicenantes bacterium]|nr:ankyrin repeat domain-containing protein [Candidatus Aminicenantes bacterium]
MKKSILLIISFGIVMIFHQSLSAQETHGNEERRLKSAVHHYVATYFGGSANESAWAIALDEESNVYVAGYTASPDFPTTKDSYNSVLKGKGDVFVLKFDKDLKTVLASAIIGGSEDEVAYSMLYDKKGYVYIAGYTSSKNFPVTPSAYCPTYNGGEGDAFILKMDKDLKSLTASTFLGGSGNEDDWYSAEIVMDEDGDVYMAGNTASSDFPTTQGAYCSKYNGGNKDIFISKFDGELKKLLASTFLGGTANDQISRSLRIDNRSDEICLAGITFSPDFPTTPGAYSRTISGRLDGYVAKLAPDLSKLTRSTILPSGWIYCLLIHENGDIYVGGHTGTRLPTTPQAFYQTFEKHGDQGFISRFSNDLAELKSSTVLPGTGTPGRGGEITSLNLSQSSGGDIVSAGWAGPRDFPSTPNALDETQNGEGDTYVLKMNKDLSVILASTFVGGSRSERWNRMITDGRGKIYIASYTLSPDFPTTKGAAFETFHGVISDEEENLDTSPRDGFLIKIDEDLSAAVFEEFHDAAKRDQVKPLGALLSANRMGIEKRDKYQRTPLHSAARYGALSAVQYLIEEGADLNAKDEGGNTPLHLAALHCQDKAAELIVQANPDLNALNDDGDSPLSLAVVYGTPKTLGLLLSNKADKNIRDQQGNTLLHIAAVRGNIEKVRELLKYKLGIEMTNGAGETPLLSAVKKYENEAIISCLLDNGANIATVDSSGRGALHVANNSNIKFLLHRGADVNLQDGDGNTPLHKVFLDLLRYKVFYPSLRENTNLFLEAGADANVKNNEGKTPLDLAVESGVQEAVELLKTRQKSGQLEMSPFDFPKLNGPYLGQKPPGLTPEIFAPGIVSTDSAREFSGTFSPDGKEYYFFRFADGAGMMVSQIIGDRWSAPRPASFNSKYIDNEPHITPDGKRMFFCSNRPYPGSGDQRIMTQVWVMERDGDTWGAPKHLGMGMMPSTSEKGRVFIGPGVFELADDKLLEIGTLDYDPAVPQNERLMRQHTCMAPDESYHL